MLTHELLEFADVPGVEIGAHTQSHPRLANLTLEDQTDEIVGSRLALQDALGSPVSSFAYPFGRRSDFTQDTVDLLEQASFELACSTERGVVAANADRFRLPRLQVHDWNGAEFGKWLANALSER
jgi:peptidoglycan/xylan/chitin deacetylase (PgdA/CDA1 family)